MDNIYHSLLRNKFLILILLLGLTSFLFLFLAETYLDLAPRVTEILRSVAAALLTSGVVGFVFDYQTRKEFVALIAATVQRELFSFEKRILKKPEGRVSLYTIWQPLVKEGLSIIIPEDELGPEPLVRAADVSAALILYKGLVQSFSWQESNPKISVEFVPKHKYFKDLSAFDGNLVILGAPGSNPLSVAAFNALFDVSPNTNEIRNGYIFSVDASRPQKYLDNPYIVPCGDENPALLELKDKVIGNRYDRYESKHIDGVGSDACLLVHGIIPSREGRARQVLVIAGHSRFSCIDGIEFVLSNEKWADDIKKFQGTPSATVLSTSISIARGRVVTVVQSPHMLSGAK